MDGGADATRGLPMLPPPAPTFRAPTRESVLLQMGTRPSSFTTEEDLSFMDAEVRTAAVILFFIFSTEVVACVVCSNVAEHPWQARRHPLGFLWALSGCAAGLLGGRRC